MFFIRIICLNLKKLIKISKMKKILVLSLGLLFMGSTFTACKKGENDPFMSMKSRKARVAGEWTVSGSEGTEKETENFDSQGDSYTFVQTETSTYNGVTNTTVATSVITNLTTAAAVTDSETTTSTYTETYSFDKEGTYVYTRLTTYSDGSSNKSENEGTWSFLGKNKTSDLKSKEAIMTSTTKVTTTSTDADGTSTVNVVNYDSMITQMFKIDQLKNKEMILIMEGGYTLSNGDSYSSIVTSTLTAN
jgi:hypothetical protein